MTDDPFSGNGGGLSQPLFEEITNAPLPWRPIAELTTETRYGDEVGFLLLAPELIDEDCNMRGVGMGYYQDNRDVPSDENGACGEPGVDYGGWMACKWSMTNDEWREVPCTPTHYLRLTGVFK